MHIAYWVVAALLAALYLYAGGKKLTQSAAQLAPMMGWVDTIPMPVVRSIGAVEVAGALGLVLPRLTGIAVWLGAVAAIGFVLLQALGTALHLSRGEGRVIGLNVALVVLAAVAAWLTLTW